MASVWYLCRSTNSAWLLTLISFAIQTDVWKSLIRSAIFCQITHRILFGMTFSRQTACSVSLVILSVSRSTLVFWFGSILSLSLLLILSITSKMPEGYACRLHPFGLIDV